ncbi:unnamed protein product [Withania somnifera]
MSSNVVDRAKNSSVRLICRYPKSDSNVPFIKFGPLFEEDDQDFVKKAKKEAWQCVVRSSKSREAIVTEIYISSIRQIEDKAKASYAPDSALDKLSNKDFRDMMLKDSCLFLQLLFSLLCDEDDVKWNDFPHLKNISLNNRHKWVESMLHVGNQIPMVVLRELLKKSYFQKIIKNGKWKEPSLDLAKKALFRVVLSPELHRQPPRWCIKFPWVGKHAHWTQQLKECCDVLHGIHLLLLGPEIDPEKEEYDDDDDDDDDFHLEEENTGVGTNTNVDALAGGSSSTSDAGYKDKKEDGTDDDDNSNFKNVIKLKQAGVHFGTTKGGIRGIMFKSNLIFPKLYLPPLFVGAHTSLLLQRLKQYEQNLDSSLREVSSYLQFMRDLVHTTQDAKILAFYGIIIGNRKYTEMLPTIFTGLAPHGKMIDASLNPVKTEINSFYRPPWVSSYFTIVFLLTLLAMLISIVQTVYAILAYHKPPSSSP